MLYNETLQKWLSHKKSIHCLFTYMWNISHPLLIYIRTGRRHRHHKIHVLDGCLCYLAFRQIQSFSVRNEFFKKYQFLKNITKKGRAHNFFIIFHHSTQLSSDNLNMDISNKMTMLRMSWNQYLCFLWCLHVFSCLEKSHFYFKIWYLHLQIIFFIWTIRRAKKFFPVWINFWMGQELSHIYDLTTIIPLDVFKLEKFQYLQFTPLVERTFLTAY